MSTTIERRFDTELRAVIDRALAYQETHGRSSAASYLVENYVPAHLFQRVLMLEPVSFNRIDI